MFCLCLSANLPSGSENMSVTEFPVFLALVKPVFLCVSPVCCNTPGQCLFLLLPPSSAPTRCSELLQHPRSCCLPSTAWAHVGGAGRPLPALMPLLFSTGRCGLCPALPCGTDVKLCHFFTYQLLLLTELVGLCCIQPHAPLTNWAGISVSEGSSDRLCQCFDAIGCELKAKVTEKRD